MEAKFRIGHGFDVHALAEGLPLWLGGVRVDHTKGCVAHSDGDVAIHAVCDALLGAAALGDIGKLFPDTSDEFKGIDSKILLRRVTDRLAAEGYAVGNGPISTPCAQRWPRRWASLRSAFRSRPPRPNDWDSRDAKRAYRHTP